MATSFKPKKKVPIGVTGAGGNKGTDLGAPRQTFQVGNTKVSQEEFGRITKGRPGPGKGLLDITEQEKEKIAQVGKEKALRDTARQAFNQEREGAGLPQQVLRGTPEELQAHGQRIQDIVNDPETGGPLEASQADISASLAQADAEQAPLDFLGQTPEEAMVAKASFNPRLHGNNILSLTKGVVGNFIAIGKSWTGLGTPETGDVAEAKEAFTNLQFSMNQDIEAVAMGGSIQQALDNYEQAVAAKNVLKGKTHRQGLDNIRYWKNEGKDLEDDIGKMDRYLEDHKVLLLQAFQQSQIMTTIQGGTHGQANG